MSDFEIPSGGEDQDLSSYLQSVDIADINATGTPSDTTFLRGDGKWETLPGGGGGLTAPQVASFISIRF